MPLADCSSAARGLVLSNLVRRMDEGWFHPNAAFEDAVAVLGDDGKKKRGGQHTRAYDWKRDGRFVACKSGQLRWQSNAKTQTRGTR